MLENDLASMLVNVAAIITVFLLAGAAYRAFVGPTVADRLVAVDLFTTLLVGNIILLAVLSGEQLLIDIGLALAALAFIGSIGIARYVGEGKVF